MLQNILMVCVGNICRSPVAEALFKQKLAEASLDISVSSAGISAVTNSHPDPVCVNLMNRMGLDISNYRAKQLSNHLAEGSDLILVMKNTQIKAVTSAFFSAYGKVYCIGRWGDFDIADPHGKRPEEYEKALALINRGIDDWLVKIKRIL
jgi:protein-tyrosine phosphatase